MSLSIEVPSNLERRLREAARVLRVDPADLTWQVLDEHLPPAHPEATPLLYGNQDVVGDTVAQQANRVGERIIDRQLDVQPTITIRSGWPLRVLVNKDMVLAAYQPE